MKIRMTFEFDDRSRKAVGNYFGDRIASRESLRNWIEGLVDLTLDDLLNDYDLAVSEGHAHVPD